MANKKKMGVEAAVTVTGVEKAEQQLDNLHKKGSEDILIDIKADTSQIKDIRDSLSDVKTDIRNIEQAFGRSIDKIKSKSGKVEFSNIRQSLVDITESLNTIDKFVSGINFKELGIDQIPKLATALDEIHTTIKGISRDLNFDKIRPFEDVQKDIENSNSALKVANKEANKLKLIQRELRKESGGIYKSFFEDENAPDNLNQYIVKLKEFLRLGGDIDKLQFDVEIKDNYTQEVEKVKRSLRDIKEQLEVSGIDVSFFDEFKGANNAIENVKILTSKIKGLEEELDRAEAKGKRDIKVNIDDSSIKALSDTLSELTNTFKIEEGSTIGFKSEDIEKITQAFAELKSVVIEIKDLLKTFDIPKIKPDGDTAIRNWISDLERAGEVAKSTDKAIEEAFKVSKAQDAGSSVDLLKNSLEEQAIENSEVATRAWISSLEEAGEAANRTDKAIEEAFRVSNAQDGGSAVDLLASSLREAEEQAEKQAELMRTADFAFKKDTHQGEYKPQEALSSIQKTNETLQETQQQAKLTATELERINTAFQKDTHTTNEDSLIPRETISVAREVNNTLEQTEDITKRIPRNVEETALALRETSQQARSAAEEIEQAFRADIDQKSKDNMIPTETLPAVREINDAFEQTGEIGTTALVRIDSEAENTIGIFKRLADVVENIFRIASTSDNIIDLDESQYRFVDAEESQYRPTDTADSVRGLIEEKTQMDNVGEAASKTAKKKREFAEANQSVLASIKESLKGLSDETEAFNALNALIKTMGKNSEMGNTIEGLEVIKNLLSSPLDNNSMVSAIKELAAQGDVLKDVANVLKNASKQKLANAKESLKGDTEKVDKKAQREKEKAEKEKLKAIEKAQTQEIKNQNKLYNESIRLLEQIDKLKLKNLSLSPTSDAYIKNEHDIRKKENQYNDNLDKLDLQKRADLTAELRQKNDQYNDSLAETARAMAEVNAQGLESSLEKLNDANIISFNDRINKMIANLRSVDSAVSFNNLKSKLNELVGDINKKFDYIKKSAGKLLTDVDIGKWSDKLQKEILDSVKVMPKLKEEAQEVFNELQKLKESKIDLSTEEAQNHLKELKDRFDKVLGKKKLDEYKAASADTISKLNIKIDEFVKKNTAMGHDFQERFKNLKLEWDAATSIEEVKKLEVEFNKLKSEVYEADKTGASFFDTLRQRAMGVNAQLIAQYLSWQDMIRYARQAAEAVISVDTALTELRKVSGASTERLQESFEASTETAKELGRTISDVINSTADWSRAGFSVDQAEELARVSTLYQNVGDNIDAAIANEHLVSTLRGFHLAAEDAERIVDVFNEVGNNFSIDTAGIGEALQRSASVFYNASTDLNSAVSLITGANEIVQDPARVGNAWKSISARIRASKIELEEMGEDTEDMFQTTSAMADYLKKTVNVDILDAQGNFRNLKDIVVDLGKAFEKIDDQQLKQAVAEKLAGKTQMNVLLSAISNYKQIEKAYETAAKSAGKLYYLRI